LGAASDPDQAEKIIGVMIDACVQARLIGPFSVKLMERSAAKAHVIVANGSVAMKMIPK